MQKLVEVTRSGFIESVHYGCGAIVDSTGKILKEWVDRSELIYPRSVSYTHMTLQKIWSV